eukprot:Filipodium_phascolosomae@DN5828_c0_g1_i3.p1
MSVPDMSIGVQFVQHYYQTFDTNRAALATLYGPDSMLTFEEEQRNGAEKIVEKLVSLSFQKVQHIIVKADVQPVPPSGGLIVFVTGNLLVDENPNALKFAQVFHLVQNRQTMQWYCLNDLFRLNIG